MSSGRGPAAAFALFSVLPVRSTDAAPDPRVLRWFPVVGAVLGALAFVPALAVWRGDDRGSALLAATLVVIALALLTRGLHLDGAADLADALGSRRPPDEARAIMRRSDIGAFGVAAIVGLLLLQVVALGTAFAASSRLDGLVTVLVAAVTGRVAVLRAAGAPASPGSAFGSLVAGSIGPGGRAAATVGLVAVAALARVVTDGSARQVGWTAAAVVVALAVADLLRWHAVRRLGGVSGDVFGALVEVGTTVALVVLAAEPVWR